MSEQKTTNSLPEECGRKTVTNGDAYSYDNIMNLGLEQCLRAINKKHQQQESLVGGLNGTGGLICGAGLCPFLIKLITKLKG